MKFFGFVATLTAALIPCAVLAEKTAPAPPPPPAGGAMEAVNLIPKEAARRVARVEAREGHPNPERWYVLVFDPDLPAGVREFVISAGRIAAARQLSQFADSLTEPESFDGGMLRADSEYCTRLGNLYASANGLKAASFDYELARPRSNAPGNFAPKGETTWPVWHLTVLDDHGDQLGMLTISAARGTVLAHDGFEKAPESVLLPPLPTPPPASITNPKPAPKKPDAKAPGKKGKK